MTEPDIVLRFEIEEGSVPDAEKIVKALQAWIDLMKIAGDVIEPGSTMEVGLAGVADGSDIFKFTLKRVEQFLETVKDGASEYPLASKAAMTLSGLIGTTVVGVIAQNALASDPRLPDDQMKVFIENNELLKESNDLRRQQMKFYGILHEEPAIENFEVIRPHDDAIIYRIPRDEFAARSGLWGEEEQNEKELTDSRIATWDVVLIKAVLIPEPRRWMFARDGIEFSALMDDKVFLEAIHDKTLPIRMAEGIRLTVEVKYKVKYESEGWIPVKGSHVIKRVLDPLAPTPVTPLFPNSGLI